MARRVQERDLYETVERWLRRRFGCFVSGPSIPRQAAMVAKKGGGMIRETRAFGAILVAVFVTLASCGGGDGTAPKGPDLAAYRQRVRQATSPVVEAVAPEWKPTDAATRERVATMRALVQTAQTQVQALTPPAALASAHSDLLTAMNLFLEAFTTYDEVKAEESTCFRQYGIEGFGTCPVSAAVGYATKVMPLYNQAKERLTSALAAVQAATP